MLALDLVEQRGGDLGPATIQVILGLRVKTLDISRNVRRIRRPVGATAARCEKHGRGSKCSKGESAADARIGLHKAEPIASTPLNAK